MKFDIRTDYDPSEAYPLYRVYRSGCPKCGTLHHGRTDRLPAEGFVTQCTKCKATMRTPNPEVFWASFCPQCKDNEYVVNEELSTLFRALECLVPEGALDFVIQKLDCPDCEHAWQAALSGTKAWPPGIDFDPTEVWDAN